MSKIIKAKSGKLQEFVPFDFSQMLGNQPKSSPHCITMLGGALEILTASPPPQDIETSVRDLLLDAERKAQELEEQAYRKGYEQGQKDGFEVGQRAMSIVKGHLEGLFQELQVLPETLLKTYRNWLIEMCLHIARRLVRRELATDGGELSQLIDTLLREAVDDHALTVHLHPDDLAMLEQHVDLKLLAAHAGRNFSLKADAHLERGGCRMENDLQLIDASIEKQFDLIAQALKNDESTPDQILI